MEPSDPYRAYSRPASPEPPLFDSSRLAYADPYSPPPRRRRLGPWLGAAALIIGLVGSSLTPTSILQAPSRVLSGPDGLLTQLGGPFADLGRALAPGNDAAQAQSDPTQQAVKDVVQKANDEQVQAIAARDPSGMADTATAQHYKELVQINQDLLDAGVTRIELLNLSWGSVSVEGSTAHASTTETWRSTYANGATDRSQDRNDYTLVLDNGSWKISADDHPADLPVPGLAPQPPSQPAPPGARPGGPGTSRNWSGYAASGGTFTSVTGTWVVPDALSAQAAPGADATWVGIGGVRSQDLIQAGTQETVSGTGRVRYEAWIEMLPRPSRPVQLPVHPGDQVTVTISEQSPDNWLIAFNNATTGETYQQTVTYSSSHSSAEWVEEAPSAGRRILPLSNFGTIQFSAGSAERDGQTLSIADLKGRAITMIDRGGQALATTSPLAADGSSFSVSRTDVAATAAPQTTTGGGGRRGGGGDSGQDPSFSLFP